MIELSTEYFNEIRNLFINSYEFVKNEFNITVDDKGLSVCNLIDGNVLLYFFIPANMFSMFNVPNETTFSVKSFEFVKILKKLNSENTLISVTDNSINFISQVRKKDVKYSMSIFHCPKEINLLRKKESLNKDNTIKLLTQDFSDSFNLLTESDKVLFYITKEKILLKSDNDYKLTNSEISITDFKVLKDCNKDFYAKFNYDYIFKTDCFFKSFDYITISGNTDYPFIFESDTKIEACVIIAPMINT